MARRKLVEQPIVVQVKFRSHRGEDDDLLNWFEQIPAQLRVAAVKAAIRGGGMNLKSEVLPGDDEVERALDALLGI
jgi:hypothetical protein